MAQNTNQQMDDLNMSLDDTLLTIERRDNPEDKITIECRSPEDAAAIRMMLWNMSINCY
jgi:low affinity Fe/Cu permease